MVGLGEDDHIVFPIEMDSFDERVDGPLVLGLAGPWKLATAVSASAAPVCAFSGPAQGHKA